MSRSSRPGVTLLARFHSTVKHWQAQFPALHPLTLVLKQFLVEKGLNDPFTGGLSSYGLVLMLVCVLEKHRCAAALGKDNAAKAHARGERCRVLGPNGPNGPNGNTNGRQGPSTVLGEGIGGGDDSGGGGSGGSGGAGGVEGGGGAGGSGGGDSCNLGLLLVDFLWLFARSFDPSGDGIGCVGGRLQFFKRQERTAPGGGRGGEVGETKGGVGGVGGAATSDPLWGAHMNNASNVNRGDRGEPDCFGTDPLVFRDPLDSSNNVGRSCYAYPVIRSTLGEALDVICNWPKGPPR
jgi:hypothetical protein